MKPKKITLAEFEEKYMKPVKTWDFSKFSILCKKCGGSMVEYNNSIEVGYGYYDDIEHSGALVVKCHDCGNAFRIKAYDFVDN